MLSGRRTGKAVRIGTHTDERPLILVAALCSRHGGGNQGGAFVTSSDSCCCGDVSPANGGYVSAASAVNTLAQICALEGFLIPALLDFFCGCCGRGGGELTFSVPLTPAATVVPDKAAAAVSSTIVLPPIAV